MGLQIDITDRFLMSFSNTSMQGAQISVVSDKSVDYCFSGKVRRIDVQELVGQLDSNGIVLLCPIGVSVTGDSFNLTTE